MTIEHPAATTRVVTAGLSVTTALGIVAVLADDPDVPATPTRPDTIEVVVPDGVDDDAARDAVREWLDRDGEPPQAPRVLLDADRPDTVTRSS